MARIVIQRDAEDLLTMTVEDDVLEWVGMDLSENMVPELKAELKRHLGGEFSDEFDPAILAAIQMLEIENG